MNREKIFQKTIELHKKHPEIRIASSLSLIDILVVLYYKILNLIPFDENRDRVIFSKGHGAIGVYPILADLGFFDESELDNVGKNFLTSIPDPNIKGIETINGSLGHGLGVGVGIAVALKKKKLDSKVYVICGDGELYEGSMWEAIMFAPTQKLDNLILVVDYNKTSMLDRVKNIIDLEPLKEKFLSFNWEVFEADGHNLDDLEKVFKNLNFNNKKPKVVIAHTIKGKGVDFLEKSSISHILSLKD